MFHVKHQMPKQYGHPPVHKQAPVPHQVKQEAKPVFPKAPPNAKPFFDALSKDDQNKQKSWLV